MGALRTHAAAMPPRGGGRKGNPQQQVRFQSAASGADNAASGAGSAVMIDNVEASSAESLTRRRETNPIRPGAVVTPKSGGRPEKSGQGACSLHAAYDQNGVRVAQEWFMAPFLVEWTEVTSVADVDSEAELATHRVPSSGARTAASGASKLSWRMHYTNIRREACLARSHPLVDTVMRHKLH